MKKSIIIGIILALMLMLFSACSDDTVTYYKDYNGNGKCDYGEGVYYEDSTGTHFID